MDENQKLSTVQELIHYMVNKGVVGAVLVPTTDVPVLVIFDTEPPRISSDVLIELFVSVVKTPFGVVVYHRFIIHDNPVSPYIAESVNHPFQDFHIAESIEEKGEIIVLAVDILDGEVTGKGKIKVNDYMRKNIRSLWLLAQEQNKDRDSIELGKARDYILSTMPFSGSARIIFGS